MESWRWENLVGIHIFPVSLLVWSSLITTIITITTKSPNHQITISIITILSRSGSNVPIVLSLGQTAEADFKEDDWKRLEAEMIIADTKGWSKWSRWSLPTQGYTIATEAKLPLIKIENKCKWSSAKAHNGASCKFLTFAKFVANSNFWKVLP